MCVHRCLFLCIKTPIQMYRYSLEYILSVALGGTIICSDQQLTVQTAFTDFFPQSNQHTCMEVIFITQIWPCHYPPQKTSVVSYRKCPWNSSAKNTGVAISSTRGTYQPRESNPHFLRLLHRQVNSSPLAPPGKPLMTDIFSQVSEKHTQRKNSLGGPNFTEVVKIHLSSWPKIIDSFL